MENRIREEIAKSGRTLKSIAEEIGMTSVGLSQLASAKMPKVETMEKIATALGIPTWRLMLSDEDMRQVAEWVTLRKEVLNFCPACGAPLRVVAERSPD